MSELVLNLKRRWFFDIQSGVKREEYRLVTPYWTKRLKGKKYTWVTVCLGYPKKGDTLRRITRLYRGYKIKTVRSPEWGNRPRRVYAIDFTGLPKKTFDAVQIAVAVISLGILAGAFKKPQKKQRRAKR